MNRTPLRRLLTGVVAAALGVSLLTSCAGQPDLDDAVAAQLQTRVAAAKERAAQQDFPAVLAELGQLSQEVATAAGQGRITQQRRSRIEAAIGTIRRDLEASLAPAPSATAPATAPQLTEDQQEQAEEAQKEAEEEREKAQKEAEKQREDAQKEAEKQRDNR
ncbi:phage regulatory CII family protein [Arthrobacter sp. Alg241-R88]|uniref:phage regulatory CII family protein n=1 Tax=Arthrobacter sp. Alg241-R88 TaxID=2305984 RepID=UPI0013D69BFB|nr:phage regulatory CII family protein [Arthrobacter sp. Alg241-R88]